MVPVGMLSNKSIFEKASRFAVLVDVALQRINEPNGKMTILRKSEDGSSQKTRDRIACDFTKAANLALLDAHIMPQIIKVMDEAGRREMTAVSQNMSEQARYAIHVLGSVSKMDYTEITYTLHPELRPKPVETGKILSFPRFNAAA